MKKVLLIIIDALATRILEPALASGRLPNLAKLVDAGALYPECIAVFPSITPAATGSLATGCYPSEHGILGAHWYDEEADDVAYFGSDVWTILNEGVGNYILDFQRELNAKRLLVPTVFESVEKHGHLQDAVINLLWFRGTVEHPISWPTLLKAAPGTSESSMFGPHLMFMGDFVNTPLARGQQLSARGGLTRRFGFHDDATADYLLQLAEHKSLPDLTIAYFPDNDFDSHKVGPAEAVSCIESFDETLGRLFDTCGGMEAMLSEYAILITGDHAQSDLKSAVDAEVDLEDALADFQLVPAGKTWRADDDVMVCPNMRAAQIYFRDHQSPKVSQVIERLLTCEGVDQVMWCDAVEGLQNDNRTRFHVATSDRGELSFRVAERANAMGIDEFGGHWDWSGELSAVDARVDADKRLVFNDYPNALERVATSFHQLSGTLWVTAKIGREFRLPATTCNEGGSHGSLHSLDSISPLVAAGVPAEINVPRRLRSVDITPICLQVLGLETPRMPGESHVHSA